MQHAYKDFAIILTWPDATIRGDEAWMMFFKKIGLVKNLNFKVGHTGIVIVNHDTGEMLFYDFGRYISPRGYGRARSQNSDPRLAIDMTAEIKDGCIKNVEDIIHLFEEMKPAMYGDGCLYFSIAEGINFEQARVFGDYWVEIGTYPYGAVAKKNNNCSRFITRMLMVSSSKYHYWHGLNLPETIKASPISNVVNSVSDRMIYSFCPEKGLKNFRMNRWQSFFFLLKQLGDNISQKKSDLLPTDQIIGAIDFGSKPISIPKDAQYLGGVGDGAWYSVSKHDADNVLIKRYTTKGMLEYVVLGEANKTIDFSKPWKIAYDSHYLFTHVEQDGVKIRIKHLKSLPVEDFKFNNLKELYA